MTAYFDKVAEDVAAAVRAARGASDGGAAAHAALVALERRLVDDVTVAAESPGFPDDLRVEVHRTIVARAVDAGPVNAPPREDLESLGDRAALLAQMENELHSIFHHVARRGVEGFWDDPRAPVFALRTRGEAYREQLVAAAAAAAAQPAATSRGRSTRTP